MSDRRTERPINAAEAARKAAHASGEEEVRLRRAAMGGSAARAAAAGRRARGGRGPLYVGVAIGAVLALICVIALGRGIMGVLLYDERAVAESAQAALVEAADDATDDDGVLSVVAGAEESISFGGSVYLISEVDGAYCFGTQLEGSTSDPLSLFDVTAAPVGFALYEGTFYVVSTADDAYYVQAYVPGDGSIAADYRSGEGAIASIALEDAMLALTTEAGETISIDLA